MNHSDWRSHAAHLPIFSHLRPITEGIASHQLTILDASPGSGKTTILPLALAEQPWVAGRSIIVLQPRRLAAKSVAQRMAELLGESVGETVGYHVRLESRVSSRTRIEVLTEGLLTKRLLQQPELPKVAAVIFDEFHERTVHADIALALTKEVATVLRNDLKIVVMSATLGGDIPSNLEQGSWRYTFQGTPHPVSIAYHSNDYKDPIWQRVARSIHEASLRYDGDILAFLPGMYEIERTREHLERSRVTAVILPLFGDLPYSDQQMALMPLSDGSRKIILSTPIAETSLTIEGVRVVVDSGLHKVARTETSGSSSLRTERISRDAADQRAGRAGRTAPGVCIRLWSEHEHNTLRPSREPEVLRSDLSSALLDLAVWGVRSFEHFDWITTPPPAAIKMSRDLLIKLGALTDRCEPTGDGKLLARLGTDPRLGMMLLMSRRYGLEDTAASLVSILEERDLVSSSSRGVAIADRLELLRRPRNRSPVVGRACALRDRWTQRLAELPIEDVSSRIRDKLKPGTEVGFLLALAYPTRIARRRSPDSKRYLMASGAGAILPEGDPLSVNDFIVIASMRDASEDARISLAAPLDEALFLGPLSHLVTTKKNVEFDQSKGSLTVKMIRSVGSITIHEEKHHQADPSEMRDALVEWLSTPAGFSRLPFSQNAQDLRARLAWARENYPNGEFPDLSDQTLISSAREWLEPFLPARAILSSISEALLDKAISASLPWEVLRKLDACAPVEITLPNGRARKISYKPGAPPVLEAVIQELFGMHETPRIGPARIPLSLHLLSPARRPMQVTQDLAGFWVTGYPEIRRELRGRYPKHRWPENPTTG